MLPTDGTELAVNAVKEAIAIAKPINAKITAVYVIDSRELVDIATNIQGFEKYDAMKAAAEKAVKYVEDECRAAGIEFESIITENEPAKYIVENSDKYGMIVMGTSGKKGFRKIYLGSVADVVIREAMCPVLTTKA